MQDSIPDQQHCTTGNTVRLATLYDWHCTTGWVRLRTLYDCQHCTAGTVRLALYDWQYCTTGTIKLALYDWLVELTIQTFFLYDSIVFCAAQCYLTSSESCSLYVVNNIMVCKRLNQRYCLGGISVQSPQKVVIFIRKKMKLTGSKYPNKSSEFLNQTLVWMFGGYLVRTVPDSDPGFGL